MDIEIIPILESYKSELDNLSNQVGHIGNYREASRTSNLGWKVQQLINSINEFENNPIEPMEYDEEFVFHQT